MGNPLMPNIKLPDTENAVEATTNDDDAAQVGSASAEDIGEPKQHLSRDEVEAFGLDPFVYGYGKADA
jgi:hypothetical protein